MGLLKISQILSSVSMAYSDITSATIGNGNSPRWLENSHYGASPPPDPAQDTLTHSTADGSCSQPVKRTLIKEETLTLVLLNDAVVRECWYISP